jgi:hypothetical protein
MQLSSKRLVFQSDRESPATDLEAKTAEAKRMRMRWKRAGTGPGVGGGGGGGGGGHGSHPRRRSLESLRYYVRMFSNYPKSSSLSKLF